METNAYAVRFTGTNREVPIVAKTRTEAVHIFADRERVAPSSYIVTRKIKNAGEWQMLADRNRI